MGAEGGQLPKGEVSKGVVVDGGPRGVGHSQSASLLLPKPWQLGSDCSARAFGPGRLVACQSPARFPGAAQLGLLCWHTEAPDLQGAPAGWHRCLRGLVRMGSWVLCL